MDEVLEDVKNRLNISFTNQDIIEYTSTATEGIVFSIKEKYLIKICNKDRLNTYNTFFNIYNTNSFQKMYYINYDLKYICLSYIKGTNYKKDIPAKRVIKLVYEITSNYKTMRYKGYGRLHKGHETWHTFLKNEVEHYLNTLDEKIDTKLVYDALKTIKKYKAKKCLLHGDFGTHNFIINKDKLFVIDPWGIVGDPIYDFYYGIFSDCTLCSEIKVDEILKYFDYDIEYKKSMLVIVFFIRLCKAYKYDIDNYNIYIDYYNSLNNNKSFML